MVFGVDVFVFSFGAEEDGAAELHETTRLRDRGSKKERDRDRDRSSRSKRQRGGERLLHESNREEEGEESTEESVDDEEEEEEYEDAAQFHHRKSFPTKAVKPILPWKVPDEMTVPRKARSGRESESEKISSCDFSGKWFLFGFVIGFSSTVFPQCLRKGHMNVGFQVAEATAESRFLAKLRRRRQGQARSVRCRMLQSRRPLLMLQHERRWFVVWFFD